MVCPEGAGGVSPGFDPHKRYVNARPLDERMAFVPEGRLKSLPVPKIFIAEDEPRHEQATARQMFMPL
jgi:hypothetical protein